MTAFRIAVLDDWQHVALTLAVRKAMAVTPM